MTENRIKKGFFLTSGFCLPASDLEEKNGIKTV